MDNQTTLLADEQIPVAPQPIDLHSRHHVALIVTALDDRASAIEHLAKKAKDEGYHRIARELEADVQMIKEDLLPEIREQREIPLAGPDEARNAIAHYLRPAVHHSRVAKENEEQLLDRLGRRLVPVLERMYRRGVAMGIALREDDPQLVVVKACAAAAGDANTPS